MGKKRTLIGAVLCLITVVSYGIQFPVAEGALRSIDPFWLTAIRYGGASILLLVLLWMVEGAAALRVQGRGWKLLFFGSCGFAGYSFTVFGGQKMLGSAGTVVAAVFMALMPLLTVLATWVYKGVRPSRFTWLTTGAALTGVLLIISRGDVSKFASMGHSVGGDVLILAGAVMWVIYTIGGTEFRDWSPLRYTVLSTCLGSVTVWVMTLGLSLAGIVSVPSFHTVRMLGWNFGYMIVIAGMLALVCWNTGNKIIGPTNAVLFMNVIPLTTLFVKILQGERFNGLEMFGALIIVLALTANNLRQRRKPVAPHTSAATTPRSGILVRSPRA